MNRRLIAFWVLFALLLSGCAVRRAERVLPLPDPDAAMARGLPVPEPDAAAAPAPSPEPEGAEAESGAAPTEAPSACVLVGSRLSDRYHDPDCRYAKQIAPENLLEWDSIEAAQADGYGPCGVCKPG